MEAFWFTRKLSECSGIKAESCRYHPDGKITSRVSGSGLGAASESAIKNNVESIFGMAFLSEGRGTYSDVFYDSVEKLHQECGASVPRVLGHVMAHELGHLLLGSNAHAEIGIMRPRWYGEQLHAVEIGTLFFTPEQARLIQYRLSTA